MSCIGESGDAHIETLRKDPVKVLARAG